jgi:hypothetical protein
MNLVNKTPRFIHLMASVFAAGWAGAIFAVFLSGPPHGYSLAFTVFVLAIFGATAAGLLGHANRVAAISMELCTDGTIVVTEQTLSRKHTRHVHRRDVRGVLIEQSEDQDGAAYFAAVVCLNDGSRFVAREGTDEQDVKAAADLIKATLRY